jgi:hypothetical protein
MKRSIILCLLFLAVTLVHAQQIEQSLALLDSVVKDKEKYVLKKEKEINACKENLKAANFDTDKYLCYKRLYLLYQKFNSDSASAYAKRCLELAIDNRNEQWEQEAQLFIVFQHALCSQLPIVDEEIKRLPPIEQFDVKNRPLYANMFLSYQVHKIPFDQYNSNSEEIEKYLNYIDKPAYRLYYRWILTHKGVDEKALRHTTLSCKNPMDKAILEYSLYSLLSSKGKKDEAFYHLVKSACYDIKAANRETESLLMVVELSIKKLDKLSSKDRKRIVNYIHICGENGIIFHDLGRSLRIMEAQKKVFLFSQQLTQKRENKMIIGWSLTGAVLLAILVLYYILRKKERAAVLKSANLQKQIDEITDKAAENEKQLLIIKDDYTHLKKGFDLRNNTIIKLLFFISDNVDDAKNFRKHLSNLFNTNLIKEAKRYVENSAIMDEKIGNYYKYFDQAILTLHSDFVEKFNDLLRPEERIKLKTSDQLTPELRIFALVSLGLTDSRKIAALLHYSPQTVYNYRLKIRKSAAIDEKKFDEAVTKLYASNLLKNEDVTLTE